MTRARIALAALWMLGLALGSFSERRPAVTPRFYNGLRVLSADLHVHSFPGDGALPPWVLASEARRRRLDVIALTNHNQMLSSRLAQWFPVRSPDVLLIPGEEVTTPAFHLAAVGVEHAVGWDRSASVVANAVHGAGGVAIVAHPDDRAADAIDDGFRDMDGVETAHPARHLSDKASREFDAAVMRALHAHPGLAQIGSSDFHYLAPIGLCRTFIFARDMTRESVLEAIRAGRTVACDGQGRTYGDPEFLAVTEDACRAAANSAPVLNGQLNRIAVLCAWLGALGLTLIGPRPRVQ